MHVCGGVCEGGCAVTKSETKCVNVVVKGCKLQSILSASCLLCAPSHGCRWTLCGRKERKHPEMPCCYCIELDCGSVGEKEKSNSRQRFFLFLLSNNRDKCVS